MNKQNSISDSPQEKPSIPSGNSQFSGDNSSPAVAPAHHADDQYRLLFDSAADGILLVNVVTGQIVRANPAAEIIFGYSSDELRNKYFWELSPKKFQTTNRQFLRNFRDDHTCHFEDLPLVTKTGKPVQVEIVGSLFQMHDQQIAHFNIRDISERKTAEKAREVIYKISQAAVSTGSNQCVCNRVARHKLDLFTDKGAGQYLFSPIIGTESGTRMTGVQPVLPKSWRY
ncbi:MAG: PAS domain S-box protein [Anaerolineaceae bacterium]|nr:PAS domain S-box protein [Anaerolineaceae bacterium]